MAPNFTLSQPGGAGAGVVNDEILAVREGVAVVLTAEEIAASYAWSVVEPLTGEATAIASATSQVASWTPAALGVARRTRLRLTTPAGARILVAEVTRDASGALLDRGLVTPAAGERKRESNGKGAASVMRRFKDTISALFSLTFLGLADHETRIVDLEIGGGPSIDYVECTGSIDLDGAGTWTDLSGTISSLADGEIGFFSLSAIASFPEFDAGGGGDLPAGTVDAKTTILDDAGASALRDGSTSYVVQENGEAYWSVGGVRLRLASDGAGGLKIQAWTNVTATPTVAADLTVRVRLRVDVATPVTSAGAVDFVDPDDAFGVTFDEVAAALGAATYPVSFGGQGLTSVGYVTTDEINAGAGQLDLVAADVVVYADSLTLPSFTYAETIANAGVLDLSAGTDLQLRATDEIILRPSGDASETFLFAVVSSYAKLSSPRAIRLESTIAAAAGAIDLVAPATSTIAVAAGGFVVSVGSSSFSASGNITISAAATLWCIGSGDAILRGGSSTKIMAPTYCTFGSTSEDRILDRWPTDVALTTDAATTLLSFTPPSAKPTAYRGTIRIWDASMNVYVSHFRFNAKSVGGAATVWDYTETTSTSGLGACVTTAVNTGTNATIRATRPAGVAVTASLTFRQEQ